MTALKIGKNDQGTAYAAALQREHDQGVSKCDDAAAMAGFLASCTRILLPSCSPRLLWEGAQAVGLTHLEMAHLIEARPHVAEDLMWIETDRPVPAGVVAKVRAELEAGRTERGRRSR